MTRWNTEIPTEFEEQCKLAEYLDRQGYCWCHVPNGGNRDVVTGAKMKKQGAKPGVPDIIIFDTPNDDIKNSNLKGVAIELKRKKRGKLRANQMLWLDCLDLINWKTKVAYGADEAIDWLESIFEGDE